MSEYRLNLTIRVEIDTNKQTNRQEFFSVTEFVAWWNAHQHLHGESPLLETDTRPFGQ